MSITIANNVSFMLLPHLKKKPITGYFLGKRQSGSRGSRGPQQQGQERHGDGQSIYPGFDCRALHFLQQFEVRRRRLDRHHQPHLRRPPLRHPLAGPRARTLHPSPANRRRHGNNFLPAALIDRGQPFIFPERIAACTALFHTFQNLRAALPAIGNGR